MTLTFLSPWMLLVGLIPLTLLVILYILRMKRQELEISAVFLWRKSIDDMRANAPFQRLRMNFLFWLQLLIILCLAFALARPTGRAVPRKQRKVILMIDQSGSMAVKEADGTRMAEALRQADHLLGSLATGDEVVIVSFGNTASLVQSTTVDKFEARKKLNELKPRPVATRIDTALKIALASVNDPANTEVHLFSDGAVQDLDDVDLAAIVGKGRALPSIQFHRVGAKAANVGITAMSLRKVPETQDRYQLFVSVRNFGDKAFTGELDLCNEAVDDPIDVMPVDLAAGAEEARIFDLRITVPVGLYVKLTPLDAFPLDNRAWVATRQEQPERVLVVTEQNFFLERALDANREFLIEISKPASLPAGKGALEARLQGYAAVIFDGFSPKDLPPGRYLFIGVAPARPGWALAKTPTPKPDIIDWNTTHELMRFVSLANLYVSEASKIDAPLGNVSIIDSSAGPIAVAWEGARERFVVLGFSLARTNWPVFPSFPIFMSNALRWLSGYAPGRIGLTAHAGEAFKLPIRLPDVAGPLVLTSPLGRRTRIPVAGDRALVLPPLYDLGIYTLQIIDTEKFRFGVNMLSDAESDIRPRETLKLAPETTLKAGRPIATPRKYWPLLALLALAVLVLEWFIYFHRIRLE